MLLKFNLYDLFVLSFVQLIVATVLVLSPAREIGTRFRWTGSRITEVLVGSVGAVAITAVACVLDPLFCGPADRRPGDRRLPARRRLDRSDRPAGLTATSSASVFYASFGAASLSFIIWAAYIAVVAPTSILETVTASLVLLLDVAAFLVWMSNINYQSDVLCRARRGGRCPRPTRAISRWCRCTSRPTTSLPSC